MSLIKEALDRSEERRNGTRQLPGAADSEDYQLEFNEGKGSENSWSILAVLIVILAAALGGQLVVLLTFLWS